jgi:hypothetical protein
MLIQIPRGHVDRNDMSILEKYQINPMLAPRWDLPIARRGALELAPDEANTIFDSSARKPFEEVLKERAVRMSAPFFSPRRDNGNHRGQQKLPGVSGD